MEQAAQKYEADQFEDEIDLKELFYGLVRRKKVIVYTFMIVLSGVLIWLSMQRPEYRAEAVLEIKVSNNQGMNLEDMFMGAASDSKDSDGEIEILKSLTVARKAVRKSGYQLLLDNSERVFHRILLKKGREIYYKSRKSIFGKQEDSPLAVAMPERSPLYLELIEKSPVSEPVEYRMIFGEDAKIRILDEEERLIFEGNADAPCVTPLFTFRIHGSLPVAGTTWPLYYRSELDAVESLRKQFNAASIKKTYLVRLNLASHDPDLSARLLSSLISSYEEIKLKKKNRAVSLTLSFVERQMEVIEGDLFRSVSALKEFKKENQLVSLPEKVNWTIEKLVGLDNSYELLKTQGQQAEYLLTRLQGQDSVDKESLFALGNAMNQPLLLELGNELNRVQAQRAALRTEYTELHPTVKALDQKIANLKGKVKAETVSLIDSIKTKQLFLNKDIKGAEENLNELPEAEQSLAELTRQAAVYEDTYSFLLKKRGELQVNQASETGDLWVVDPALPNYRHVKPKLKLTLMLGVITGLMLGIMLALALEFFDDSIKRPEDVQDLLQVPVLGIVGRFVSKKGKLFERKEVLLHNQDLRSHMWEAFRTLRSNLLFSGVGKKCKVLLFTSSMPAEGKSTCSANLAISLAQTDKKVLLVDADLRKPVQHKNFESTINPGLVNAVMEEEWEKYLDTNIHLTEVKGLDFLPCGVRPPNPNEILGSEKMCRIMDYLEKRYDFIIYDAPPILSVSDGLVLGQKVDGVVVVARGGKTTKSALKNLAERFAVGDTRILGVVMNDIDYEKDRYYYAHYGYSYYNSYYGDDPENEKKGLLAKLKLWGHHT